MTIGGKLAGIAKKMALVKKEVKDEDGEMDTEKREPSGCEESAISLEYDRSQLPDLLKIYYRWLFPYDKYFDWLQYGVCVCVCVCVCVRVCTYRENLINTFIVCILKYLP